MMTLLHIVVLILFLFILYRLKVNNIQLGIQILLSLVFGIGYGLLLKLSPVASVLVGIKNTLALIGHGYLSLLKMLVIPLILTSIIHAILTIDSENGSAIKKISFMSCAMLLGMTALASLIGILIGMVFSVGLGLHLPSFTEKEPHVYTGLVDTLLAMLPSNPVAAMSQENTIAVVVFAVLLGVAARMLDKKDHDKMEIFKKWIASFFFIIKKLISLILSLTPYGIFALISLLLLEQGVPVIQSMLSFIAAMYTAMFFVFVMHGFFLMGIGQNPISYLKKVSFPLFVAFTTRSSFGTLPVTEETLRNKFQVQQMVATFVPSMGATIGMNACAGIFPAMLVVMTLTILQEPITPGLILMVMLINTIASLGISGIPGTAFIAATVTLTSLHLPYGIIALVQGIDPIIDMGRTATNVNGVLTTALVVNKLTAKDNHSE